MNVTRKQKDAWQVLYGSEQNDPKVLQAVIELTPLFENTTVMHPIPEEDGVYREYSNGVWSRFWIREEGEWYAPEGDSAEFGSWELRPLVPKPEPVHRDQFPALLRDADDAGEDIFQAIADFINTREGNA